MFELNTPYGNHLCDLLVQPSELEQLKQEALTYPVLDLSAKQIEDIELLLSGAFSPLTGFMGQKDYESVLTKGCLSSGEMWPVPIVLSVSEKISESVATSQQLALRDLEGEIIALLMVEDQWTADLKNESMHLFGKDTANKSGQRVHYLGGPVKGLTLPHHHDFRTLRRSPIEVRQLFKKIGWSRVIAYSAEKPMHKAEVVQCNQLSQEQEANLFVHAGLKLNDNSAEQFMRVRCLNHVLEYLPQATTQFSIYPYTERKMGIRSVLLDAIIQKNYGCSHMIIDNVSAISARDKVFPVENLSKYEDIIGIKLLQSKPVAYNSKADSFDVVTESNKNNLETLSEQEMLERFRRDTSIPNWYSFPEVIQELKRFYPPAHKLGFTIFFTGLSGAGKSTVANALLIKLKEMGTRSVTLLDGDVVRKNLSSELGFSKEHRNINIERIGYVASEITKHGGIAICAPIAPYRETRRKIRNVIQTYGGFIEVFVSTPLTVCENRDRKGLYAKARAGLIKEFTGISDPYEEPENAELSINTDECSPDEAAQMVLLKLESLGYLK
ncbi:MAG: adenylyl-sulfate kinase [Gammaproteobacteria bacterium]|nr:adenylyl-sulfate kinase [Gammaproteobacteria bacterium]